MMDRAPQLFAEDLVAGFRFRGEAKTLTVKIVDELPTGPVLYEKVLLGRNVIEQLTAEPLNLTEQEAIARMTGSVLGPDKKMLKTRTPVRCA